jgi:hypothetical protein
MQKENLKSLLAKFNEVVNRAIGDRLKKGPTDIDAVLTLVEADNKLLLGKVVPALGLRHVRIIIQRKLRHLLVKAAATGQPLQLNLPDMDEFRIVSSQISFVDKPGEVRYIRYAETLEWHREASIALLGKSITADQAQLQAQVAANEFAKRLVARYGDLELAILGQRWLADQNDAAAGSR